MTQVSSSTSWLDRTMCNASRALCSPSANNAKYLRESLNASSTSCKICFESDDFRPPFIRVLSVCSHKFHRECLASYIEVQAQENRFPMICPMQDCGANLREADLRTVLNTEQRAVYDELALKAEIERNPEKVAQCPGPDCTYYNLKQGSSKKLDCPKCKKTFCMICKEEYHGKNRCGEKKSDKEFKTYLKKIQPKQCPKCKFWVERSTGCDHMFCRCNTAFCYGCGNRRRFCWCKVKRWFS